MRRTNYNQIIMRILLIVNYHFNKIWKRAREFLAHGFKMADKLNLFILFLKLCINWLVPITSDAKMKNPLGYLFYLLRSLDVEKGFFFGVPLYIYSIYVISWFVYIFLFSYRKFFLRLNTFIHFQILYNCYM